jgi:acyl-CoA synthetase (AMP-forming)/AMP-acid ligase II/acyl carrier protein
VVESIFGCLLAGVAAVPISVTGLRRNKEFLDLVLKESQARFVLTSSKLLTATTERASAAQWVATDRITADAADEWRDPMVGENTIAYLQYTSGSTGVPKGVIIRHSNLVHNLNYIDTSFRHTAESRSVLWLPHFHDMGLVYGVFQPVFNGFETILMPAAAFVEKPIRWLQAITRYSATHSGGPDFAYELCSNRITQSEKDGLNLASWRVAFNGAEPVRSGTLDRFCETFQPYQFRRSSFYPAYGMAEATLKVSGGEVAGDWETCCVDSRALASGRVVLTSATAEKAWTLVSCGVPRCDTSVLICDPVSLRRLETGETGEILVASPSMMSGYWNRPLETAAAFLSISDTQADTRFFRTGDLGFLHRGHLYVCGRLKDMVVVRGRNYCAEDIEKVIECGSFESLKGGVVVFSYQDGHAERITVVVELESEQVPRARALLQSIGEEVAHECDISVDVVVAVRRGFLPRTSSGKVRRGVCRERFLSGDLHEITRFTPVTQRDPSTDALRHALFGTIDKEQGAEAVRDALSVLIGRNSEWPSGIVEIDQPLVTLGLDSLRAAELASSVEAATGIAVNPDELLGAITLRKLATFLLESHSLRLQSPDRLSCNRQPIPLGTPTDLLPLSHDQERLWWMHRIGWGAALNVTAGMELQGKVDISRLQNALYSLSVQHRALVTQFSLRSGKLFQEYSCPQAPSLDVKDLSGVSDGLARAHALESEIARCAKTPVDLEGGRPFHATLFRFTDTSYTLVFVMHHIVTDGWSTRVLLEDLTSHYLSPLPDSTKQVATSIQFSDYVYWQRSQLESGAMAADIAFWEREMSGFKPLGLKHDRTVRLKDSFTFRSASVAFCICSKLTRRVKETAKLSKVTTFTTLLSALHTAVSRFCGEPDITVCVPFARRLRPELARVVGFIGQPMPIRALVKNGQFEQLQKVVHVKLRNIGSQHDLPFSIVAERARRAAKGTTNTSLFHILFTVLDAPTEHGTSETRFRYVDIEPTHTDFDFDFRLREQSGEISGTCNYATTYYDRSTAERLVEIYLAILAEATEGHSDIRRNYEHVEIPAQELGS